MEESNGTPVGTPVGNQFVVDRPPSPARTHMDSVSWPFFLTWESALPSPSQSEKKVTWWWSRDTDCV